MSNKVTYPKYSVGTAESFKGIALRELGDESRWIEIAMINEGAMPGLYPFFPGETINMPIDYKRKVTAPDRE